MFARRRWAVAALGVALVAAACSDGSGSSPAAPAAAVAESTTTTTSTTAPVDDRIHEVDRRSEVFVDPSRPTRSNNGAPLLPERTLPTLILHPADGDGPFPLVLFSHGFTSTGPAYSALLEQIAAAGYVVAAPTFPLSSGGRDTPPELGDYVEQPADIRFVLGEVTALLPDLVDAEHVAAAGHSLGGITTLGLAFDPCCEDDRIDAFVPISGVQLGFPGEGEADFAGRQRPVLLIHGDSDGTVPFAGSTNVFEKATGPRALLQLIAGPHTPFVPPWGPVVVASIVDFLDAVLGGDEAGLDRLAEDAEVEGVATLQTAGELG